MHFVLQAIIAGLLSWPTANAQAVDCTQFRSNRGAVTINGETRYGIWTFKKYDADVCIGAPGTGITKMYRYHNFPATKYSSARKAVHFFECRAGYVYWPPDEQSGLACL